MVSTLQETIRTEQAERVRTEKEMLLMKESMAKLHKKMVSQKSVIERTYEEMHVIERVHHEIVTQEVKVVQDPAQKAMIKKTMDTISAFEKYMASFDEQISKHEAEQKASDDALATLQTETRSLSSKATENSQ